MSTGGKVSMIVFLCVVGAASTAYLLGGVVDDWAMPLVNFPLGIIIGHLVYRYC